MGQPQEDSAHVRLRPTLPADGRLWQGEAGTWVAAFSWIRLRYSGVALEGPGRVHASSLLRPRRQHIWAQSWEVYGDSFLRAVILLFW